MTLAFETVADIDLGGSGKGKRKADGVALAAGLHFVRLRMKIWGWYCISVW